MRQKIQIRHLTGILVGAAFGKLIYEEVWIAAEYLKMKGSISDSGSLMVLGSVLALGVFALVCFCFSKYGKNDLKNYLLLSIVISFAVILAILFLSGTIIRIPAVQKAIRNITQQQVMIVAGLTYLVIVFLIFIFVLSFRLLIKCKVDYIQYITNEIQHMEKEGFGRQITVKYDDELARLSMGINSMSLALKEKQDREKEQEEQKNRLIADISHDLRTPLTSIIGYTELMKENGFCDEEKCNQYLEVIDRRLGNMKTMVDQLFEYTRLTQSDYCLNLKVIKLQKMFEYIDFEYGSILRNMDFTWVMTTEFENTRILADQEKLMRAMGNLLENAKKYSVPRTEIRLEGKRQNDFVQIELSNETDHPECIDVECIFERFYKAERARMPESGTGLGLPIVKRIIELHRGTIKIEIVGRRMKVVIHLPVCSYLIK